MADAGDAAAADTVAVENRAPSAADATTLVLEFANTTTPAAPARVAAPTNDDAEEDDKDTHTRTAKVPPPSAAAPLPSRGSSTGRRASNHAADSSVANATTCGARSGDGSDANTAAVDGDGKAGAVEAEAQHMAHAGCCCDEPAVVAASP